MKLPDRPTLLALDLCVHSAAVARVVADEARVSPADAKEYEEVQTEQLRARAAHTLALQNWYDATREILPPSTVKEPS